MEMIKDFLNNLIRAIIIVFFLVICGGIAYFPFFINSYLGGGIWTFLVVELIWVCIVLAILENDKLGEKIDRGFDYLWKMKL